MTDQEPKGDARDPKLTRGLSGDQTSDFDQMELKSDIPVHHLDQPPVRRETAAEKPAKSGGPAIPFLIVLFLGAAGTAGFFYHRSTQLADALGKLQQQVAQTASNLDQTSGSLKEAEGAIKQAQGVLTEKESTISGLNSKLDKLVSEKTRLEGEVKSLKKSVAEKEDKIKAGDKELKSARDALKSVEGQLKETDKKLAGVTKDRDRLKSDLAALQKSSEDRIAGLASELESKTAQYQKELTQMTEDRDDLRTRLGDAEDQVARLKRQFQEESEASLQIIQERSELRTAKSKLESQVRKLESDLNAARERVKKAETVDFGDLVPFDDEVTPGEVVFREPLANGLKIPRKQSPVVVQVYVSEVGAVKNAFILPGQTLDAEIAKALVQSLYKWKFTPPSYRDVRVKTWQTVLVTAE